MYTVWSLYRHLRCPSPPRSPTGLHEIPLALASTSSVHPFAPAAKERLFSTPGYSGLGSASGRVRASAFGSSSRSQIFFRRAACFLALCFHFGWLAFGALLVLDDFCTDPRWGLAYSQWFDAPSILGHPGSLVIFWMCYVYRQVVPGSFSLARATSSVIMARWFDAPSIFWQGASWKDLGSLLV